MTLSFVFQQLRTLGGSHNEEGVPHMKLVIRIKMLARGKNDVQR